MDKSKTPKNDDSIEKIQADPGDFCLGLTVRLHPTNEVLQNAQSLMARLLLMLDEKGNKRTHKLPAEVYLYTDIVSRARNFLAVQPGATVPPGGQVTLDAQPQVVFRATRLVIDDASAPLFDVIDIKVGKNSQLIGSGSLPGSGFTNASHLNLGMDTAKTCQYMGVTLVNKTDRFLPYPSAMFVGHIPTGKW
jgi:hypothetical protein